MAKHSLDPAQTIMVFMEPLKIIKLRVNIASGSVARRTKDKSKQDKPLNCY